jgi:nucleotide-binding universal stress UspA family protein
MGSPAPPARPTPSPGAVEVSAGRPADILSALSARVNLLVMGSGHVGPAGRVSLGSTANDVLDATPCDVLLATRLRDAAAV